MSAEAGALLNLSRDWLKEGKTQKQYNDGGQLHDASGEVLGFRMGVEANAFPIEIYGTDAGVNADYGCPAFTD